MMAEDRKRFIDRGGPAHKTYKNNIFLPQKCLFCPNKTLVLQEKGAEAVQFLVEPFNFLGFEGQNWMLIVAGLISAFFFFVWKTRDRI